MSSEQQRPDRETAIIISFKWSRSCGSMKIWMDITCVCLCSALMAFREMQSPPAEPPTNASAREPPAMQLFFLIGFVCCCCNADEISARITLVWQLCVCVCVWRIHRGALCTNGGSGQSVICRIQTEFMIHYTSLFLSTTRAGDNETLTSFLLVYYGAVHLPLISITLFDSFFISHTSFSHNKLDCSSSKCNPLNLQRTVVVRL